MIGRRAPRPLTAEENRARNIARIMNPRRRTLRDRAHIRVWKARNWWGRHVTQRELHRRLDRLRVDLTALQRLASTPPGRPEDSA